MSYLPVWANVLLTAVALAIAGGNVLVCCVFYLNRRIRTMTNHFVISLAVSDFLVGSILVPIRTWDTNSVALGPLIAFTLIGSLANICGCTYDRFIAIHQPLRYQAILTKKRARKILCVIWTVPIFIALIPQLWQNLSAQMGMTQRHVIKANHIYLGCMVFGVLATCLALTGIYISIFRVARRHFAAISYLSNYTQPQQPRDDKEVSRPPARRLRRFSLKSLVKDVKATKLFALIGATFVLCWLPLIIINTIDSLGYSTIVPTEFLNIAMCTIFANSLVNPMIYAFFQQSFRDTVVSWFRHASKKQNSRDMDNGNHEIAKPVRRYRITNRFGRRSTFQIPLKKFEENTQPDVTSFVEETRFCNEGTRDSIPNGKANHPVVTF